MGKPLIINDFRNAYHLERMSHRNVGGQWVLAQDYANTQELTSATTNFTNLKVFTGAALINEDSDNFLYLIGDKYISRVAVANYDSYASDPFGAAFHTMGTSITAGTNPDIIVSELGTVYYTNSRYLGKRIVGQQYSSGADPNRIVDSAGRNLVSLGIKTGDKVYNLKQPEYYSAIASFATTNSTNDTMVLTSLSLSGSAYWMVFCDDFHDLGTATFTGQGSKNRQIINFDGEYYILNGNYLASLDNTEATFDATALTLKSYMNADCAAVNNNSMLIGGTQFTKGKLLLWDGSGATFTAEQNLPHPIKSIVPYLGGWMFFSGTSLYYTDGYTYKQVGVIPDTDGNNSVDMAPNGMTIVGNKLALHFVNTTATYNRAKGGLWIYDIQLGLWSFVPTRFNIADTLSESAVYYDSTNRKIVYSAIDGDSIVRVNSVAFGTDTSTISSYAMFYLPSSDKITRSINISLAESSRSSGTQTDIAGTLIVAMADAKKPIWLYDTVKTATSGTQLVLDNQRASDGDFIRVLNGDEYDEVAFITSVTNGTTDQTITLDRNIGSSVSVGDTIQIMPFKKSISQTITTLDSPYLCTNVEGSGLFILVYIKSSKALEIRSLEIL